LNGKITPTIFPVYDPANSIIVRPLLTLTFIAFLVVTNNASADQYRSKLYLDSGAQLNESVRLSLDELEQQFGSMQDSYSKSSAGRHLARHYINEKNYAKAIEFYQQALAAEGLSDIANQEMQVELATVYLLQKNYSQTIEILDGLRNQHATLSFDSMLVLAQAQAGTGDFIAVVDTLDSAIPEISTLSEQQLNRALALYYKSGSFERSEEISQQLIDLSPQTANYWRQLVSIYLAQNKNKSALDRMELAHQKKIALDAKDTVLLANLYVMNQAPEKGARILADALESQTLAANKANYQRLFEYWLQAREHDKATAALEQAVALGKDIDLALQLAQLQMERQQWQNMNSTILKTCSAILPDKYVSRANLLLGISQLKLGDKPAARLSFINATLIAGETSKAQQWLQFINAAPPNKDEVSNIGEPCVPAETRVHYVKGAIQHTADSNTEQEDSEIFATKVTFKTVPRQRLYTLPLPDGDQHDLQSLVKVNTVKLGLALVKSGGAMNGPIALLGETTIGQQSKLRLAIPYKGLPSASGRYKLLRTDLFHAVYASFAIESFDLGAALIQLVTQATAAGYTPGSHYRVVFSSASSGTDGNAVLELQLEVAESTPL
jgi:tetratricopeptide (TPR) repeat protein